MDSKLHVEYASVESVCFSVARQSKARYHWNTESESCFVTAFELALDRSQLKQYWRNAFVVFCNCLCFRWSERPPTKYSIGYNSRTAHHLLRVPFFHSTVRSHHKWACVAWQIWARIRRRHDRGIACLAFAMGASYWYTLG